MSPEARKLKLVSIAALFAGIAAIVAGIVLAVVSFDVVDVFVIAAGLGTAWLGATGARAANVPSTAPGIAPQAAMTVVADPALGMGGLLALSGDVVNALVCVTTGLFALVVLVATLQLRKALQRL